MKKRIVTTAMFLVIGFVSAFANSAYKPSDDHTIASFKRDFSNAKEVSWQQQKGYNVASFSLNGVVMTAYYDNRAGLVAVVHHVLADNLPIYLLKDLKNNYGQYWVADLYEEATPRESHYRVTLENADQIIVLNSVNSREWKVQSVIAKL
jgi:hypothetical protein